ncbi:ABC transporter permease [Roseospira marina]|uniref:ABC transporter permease n=1 Tax=Roseospira marina TaxID=140057 RepID=A0A5M6ICA2_9PROT|nr:ABC transporter permease subunit [Roseospira marina]KAA5605597.1 ABC transporter permease [Roseospira marina]MBB4313335.1 putative thiamine transport system permease protein [Roseospira marina]MBB5085924.1 putative thiamine transport system permease protein [Roseospira marina]
MTRVFPPLTLAVFLVPVLAGLAGTLLPAFGVLPGVGGTPSLEPWRDLGAAAGLGRSVALSLGIGVGAAVLSLALALGIAAGAQGTRVMTACRRALAPLLAVPHVAVALGLAFLLAPSGWLARLASPWATGWTLPPDLPTVPDPFGLAAVLALTLKETPYLLLMLLAALGAVQADRSVAVARALGYGPVAAWVRVVLPRVYPLIRLPVYAVLAYSLSVVDVALVLAPGTPGPLAVEVVRWLGDPDPALRMQGAAGAVLQTGLVAGVLLVWRLGEAGVARLSRSWVTAGPPTPTATPTLGRRAGPGMVLAVAGPLVALVALALVGMALWSVATAWFWPAPWPAGLTLDTWRRHLAASPGPLWTTVTVGVAATGLAVALALGSLEHEPARGRPSGRGSLWLLYTPLLLPQVGFLFGVQILAVFAGLDGTWGAVVWAHLLFVLPYVFLALADPHRRLDPRWRRTARSLGAGPGRTFVRVVVPLLLRPILFAAAIGFAVSVAQYLPTLFLGAGRHPTLTTEAVALAAGGDRRLIGVRVFLQAALPLLVFGLALALPRVLFRSRSAMAAGEGTV